MQEYPAWRHRLWRDADITALLQACDKNDQNKKNSSNGGGGGSIALSTLCLVDNHAPTPADCEATPLIGLALAPGRE